MEPVINAFDCVRLREVIKTLASGNNSATWVGGEALRDKLESARPLPPEAIPEDLVTMNSIVRVRDCDSGQETVYSIVFPWDSTPSEGRISVLSAPGLALFGARINDCVMWPTRSGQRAVEVVELLYQPEASRHFTL